MNWRSGCRSVRGVRLLLLVALSVMVLALAFAAAACENLTSGVGVPVASDTATVPVSSSVPVSTTQNVTTTTAAPAPSTESDDDSADDSTDDSAGGDSEDEGGLIVPTSLLMQAFPLVTTTLAHDRTFTSAARGNTYPMNVGEVILVYLDGYEDEGLTASWVEMGAPRLEVVNNVVNSRYVSTYMRAVASGSEYLRVVFTDASGATVRTWLMGLNISN